MKAEKFSEALGEIGDSYVEEAARYESKRKPRSVWWTRLAAAACLVLAVCAAVAFWKNRAPQTELPLLPGEWSKNSMGGMGYEGYMAFDVSELVSANPWREDSGLTALPVYKNPLTWNELHMAEGADTEKMRALLLDTAAHLGLDPDTLTVTDDAPDAETQKAITEKIQSVGDEVPEGYFDPTALRAEAEGIRIEVDQSLTARIDFDPAVTLPEEYNLGYSATYDEMAAAAEYLKTAYGELLAFRNPQADISGGDYNIYAEQSYSVGFFDGSGSDTERIINYNFNRVEFAPNDEGKLFIARVFRPDLSQKVGDYPIISAEKARELLLEGHYITTVPYALPGADYVKKVELIYRTSYYEEYFMPYYRFYVEVPEGAPGGDTGLNDYGAYYVPAVDGAYLESMPTWDGRFN